MSYTKLPKWVMQAMMRGDLKPRAAQVLVYVAEMTCGYNRVAYPLTAAQIAEATGLHRPHVYPALRELVAEGYLVETPDGLSIAQVIPNRYTKDQIGSYQNGTTFVPNQYKKTTKTVHETGIKPAQDADSGEAKKNSKENSKKTPLTPRRGERLHRFEEWYALYPKKRSRADAERAWAKLSPSDELVDVMKAAVVEQSTWEDWTKKGGQYVPLPASWLNGRKWTDQAEVQVGANVVSISSAPKSGRDKFLEQTHALLANYRHDSEKLAYFVERAEKVHGVKVDLDQAVAVLNFDGLDETLIWVQKQVQAGKALRREATNG